MFASSRRSSWLPLLAAGFLSSCCLPLSPRQIALVVNQNDPNSLMLAKAYAAARGIPDGRIISLNVSTAEEMDFDQYERDVVPPIRTFLRKNSLDRQIRCLVTFYGVPFRIRAKTDTPAEKIELADLEDQRTKALADMAPLLDRAEALTKSLDPAFTPPPVLQGATDVQRAGRRFLAAMNDAGPRVKAIADETTRQQIATQFSQLLTQLGGPGELVARLATSELANPAATPQARQHWTNLRNEVVAAAQDVLYQEETRYDPKARAEARRIARENFGLLKLAEILDLQIEYLKPGTTNSALDNELALLWLGYYPREGPWLNPLNFKSTMYVRVPILMVSRLDGPDVATVARIIRTSIQVEHDGLKGVLALNSFGYSSSRGADGHDAYKEFDLKIRHLGQIVLTHSQTPVVQDYSHIFKDREVANTALYCGWYSLRHYVPGMDFSPGAVGYHVASLEMVGLHARAEEGWVHGLLKDGLAATLGPVAEPYLGAFPPPQEFFPLLMTGKLTLAEVYWKTEPATSWMMALIGDPLYTPYKVNPAMKVEDLPLELRPALFGPAPRGNSSPTTQ